MNYNKLEVEPVRHLIVTRKKFLPHNFSDGYFHWLDNKINVIHVAVYSRLVPKQNNAASMS